MSDLLKEYCGGQMKKFGRRTTFTIDVKFGCQYPELRSLGESRERRRTQLAEELGYHLVMISDQVANAADVDTPFPAPFFDPFIVPPWFCEITRL
jgi:hypothetical protein